jgi:HEAT repeat protein
MGKLWEFAAKEKQAKALDYLLECLNDRSHYIRSATLDALAAVNDPRALAALSQQAESEILGMTRKTARDCLKRARDKAGQQTQIADIKKEMDTIKDENKSLKAKLAELEGKVSQMGKKK